MLAYSYASFRVTECQHIGTALVSSLPRDERLLVVTRCQPTLFSIRTRLSYCDPMLCTKKVGMGIITACSVETIQSLFVTSVGGRALFAKGNTNLSALSSLIRFNRNNSFAWIGNSTLSLFAYRDTSQSKQLSNVDRLVLTCLSPPLNL